MISCEISYWSAENVALTNTEAVTQRCSVKWVFLEILQNSQEKTCARVSFSIKAASANSTRNVCKILDSTEAIPWRCPEKFYSLKSHFKKVFNTDTSRRKKPKVSNHLFYRRYVEGCQYKNILLPNVKELRVPCLFSREIKVFNGWTYFRMNG